jgi:Flp pilus assembly protein TadD
MPLYNWTSDEVFLVAERAFAIYQQGRYREAAVLFEGLCAVDPANSYTGNALAACLYLLGEYDKVVACAHRLLRQHPNDWDARARRCEALLSLGRMEEARRDWEALRSARVHQHAKRLELRFRAAGATLLPA